MSETLLDVSNLSIKFQTAKGTVQAVRDVSFNIQKGETFSIVGESGSGKTVTALALLKLLEREGTISQGSIKFNGEEITTKSAREMRNIRGNEIAMVFQDPMGGLNPVLSIGDQVREAIVAQRKKERRRGNSLRESIIGGDGTLYEIISERLSKSNKKDTRDQIVDVLRRVGIPDPESRLDSYPHEFSGGMRQRVMIAIAISCQPKLLIVDEPTTALDVTIQANILRLLNELKESLNMTILLISHDIGVVAQMGDRTAVMYAGEIMEQGDTQAVFLNPKHPYTDGLLKSMPQRSVDTDELYSIEGSVPDLIDIQDECIFADRCPNVTDQCRQRDPTMDMIDGREVKCFHPVGEETEVSIETD